MHSCKRQVAGKITSISPTLSLSLRLFFFLLLFLQILHFISADPAVSDFHSVLRPALYVKWLKCQPSSVSFT